MAIRSETPIHLDDHAHFFSTRFIPVAGVERSQGIPPSLARLTPIRIAIPDDDSLEHDGSPLPAAYSPNHEIENAIGRKTGPELTYLFR